MSAVLFSGGLDSAVLLALERRDRQPVWPMHVRAGLAWENAEPHPLGPRQAEGIAPVFVQSYRLVAAP